jgi:hypothetical protein
MRVHIGRFCRDMAGLHRVLQGFDGVLRGLCGGLLCFGGGMRPKALNEAVKCAEKQACCGKSQKRRELSVVILLGGL